MTCGGSEDDEERMNRSGWRAMISLLCAGAGQDRLMHGRHRRVPGGLASSIPAKNLSALKPGVQNTLPPRDSGAARPAIRPWMWKSGMTLRPRSRSESSSVAAMLRADVQTLRCVSGTIFGREVVPEVCRISAMSFGFGGTGPRRVARGTRPQA